MYTIWVDPVIFDSFIGLWTNNKMAAQRFLYEIARSDLPSLYRALERELVTERKRLVTIMRLSDSEVNDRLEEKANEKAYLIQLRDELESHAAGRAYSKDEWKRFEKLHDVDWLSFEAGRLGPYIGIIEEIRVEPTDDPDRCINLDDEIPF